MRPRRLPPRRRPNRKSSRRARRKKPRKRRKRRRNSPFQISDFRVQIFLDLKAIVGLGNPGNEYKRTRHNVGFEVVDELAKRWRVELKSSSRRHARLATVKEHDVLLAPPQTFMNLSGTAGAGLMVFYKVHPADVLVVVDEVQLPLGKLRLRRSGSAGGHNG